MSKTLLENATSPRGAGGEEPSPVIGEEVKVVKSNTVTETWTVVFGSTRITVQIIHDDGLVLRARVGTDNDLTNREIRALLEVLKHYRVK
jgi:hypothetical protein